MTDCLAQERQAERIWFYKPQMYWHGLSTLLPVTTGHDDYARYTLMIGWTITGRIIIALGDCGDEECHTEAIAYSTTCADIQQRLDAND